MNSAELVVLTVIENELVLFEYEGDGYNGKPREKIDPGSWRIDNQELNTGRFIISRSVDPTSCSICKDVNDNSYILWAAGSAYPTEAGKVQHHSQRGVLGRYVLSETPSSTCRTIYSLLLFVILFTLI